MHALTGALTSLPQIVGTRPQAVGTQRGSLQRSGAVEGTTQGRTASAYLPWGPASGVASPASNAFLAGPAVSNVTRAHQETSPPPTLSLAAGASPNPRQYQNVLQRASEFAAPESVTAAADPPPPATFALDHPDDSLSVQKAEPTPASPGLPGPGAVAPAPGGAPNPGTAAHASPEQLEELAKRLTGPLIRRIKAEMLLDRERRGLRTDMN